MVSWSRCLGPRQCRWVAAERGRGSQRRQGEAVNSRWHDYGGLSLLDTQPAMIFLFSPRRRHPIPLYARTPVDEVVMSGIFGLRSQQKKEPVNRGEDDLKSSHEWPFFEPSAMREVPTGRSLSILVVVSPVFAPTGWFWERGGSGWSPCSLFSHKEEDEIFGFWIFSLNSKSKIQ